MDATWGLLAGGALGAAAAAWGQVRSTLWRAASYAIQRVAFEDRADALIVVDHLSSTYPSPQIYDRVVNSSGARIASHDSLWAWIPYEKLGVQPLIFRVGKWPLWYFPGGGAKSPNQQSDRNGPAADCATFFFLRGTVDWAGLVGAAYRARNRRIVEQSGRDRADGFSRFGVHDLAGAGSAPSSAPSVATSVNVVDGLPFHRVPRFRLIGYAPDDVVATVSGRGPLTGLFFPPDVLATVDEIRHWLENRRWYVDRDIPWKRGWLLHGLPGAGKTSLPRAIAAEFGLPVYVFHLAEMDNAKLRQHWKTATQAAPCVALFEDIDNVFRGRVNVAEQGFDEPPDDAGQDVRVTTALDGDGTPRSHVGRGDPADRSPLPFGFRRKVTFDCLLNCLDGVRDSEGVFTVVTTNRPEHVDWALGGSHGSPDGRPFPRPGRIDRVVQLGHMTRENREAMARKILHDRPAILAEQLAWLDANHNAVPETPAQWQERCARAAIAALYGESADQGGLHEGAPPGLCLAEA